MRLEIKKEHISRFIQDKTTKATEIELVRLFNKIFTENKISLAYDSKEKMLYIYNEKELFWEEYETEKFISLLYSSFYNVMQELIINRDELYKIDKNKTNFMFGITLEKIKKLIQAIFTCIPLMPEIHTPDFIPLLNGYIDLKTLEFKEPKKELYNRYSIPFKYKEDFEEPTLFLKFLEQLQPKSEHREFLLNWLAYFLVPSNPRQKSLFMIGDGSNGKGVLTRLMTTLLGQKNVSSIAIPQLHLESYQTPHLKNKVVNFAPDSDDKDQLNIGAFKALTGGDRVMVRIIGKDPFEFTYTGKLVFQVNKMPYFRTKDSAVHRRVEVLQFTNIIPEKDRIENFEEKLLADGGTGIFMILLNRARELSKIGFKFKAPQDVQDFTKMLIEDTDVIHNFFCDVLETEDEKGETIEFRKGKSDFYIKYSEYCKDNGFKVSNSSTFKSDLITYFKKREDWELIESRNNKEAIYKFIKTNIPF